MSTAFAVLPASTSVPLDAAGRGSVSFTVTNQTGTAVRVRVAVTPAGDLGAAREWLTPPETAERDIAADGAQQFTVLIAVPSRSAAGNYGFRLDAVSTRLPDEEWGQSPLVQFVVPDPLPDPIPEPIPVPKVEPKGYIESAAGALLGGFAGGLGAALIGFIVLILVAGLPTTGGTATTGNFLIDLAGALGAAFVGFIALLILVVILVALGFWIGAALGVFYFLRLRGFGEPARTAVPTAFLLPIWAIALVVVLSRLPDVDLPSLVSLILTLIVTASLIVVPALVGRAVFRFRTTGGL